MPQNHQAVRIKLLNIVLNYIFSHDWVNYDGFADTFVDRVIEKFNAGVLDVREALRPNGTTFFRLNSLSKDKFLSEELFTRIVDAWTRSVGASLPALIFADVFPEI